MAWPQSSSALQGRDKDVVESLARWVADEYQDKRKETVDTSTWRRRYFRVRGLSHEPWALRCCAA